jgi:hypothetical protein
MADEKVGAKIGNFMRKLPIPHFPPFHHPTLLLQTDAGLRTYGSGL